MAFSILMISVVISVDDYVQQASKAKGLIGRISVIKESVGPFYEGGFKVTRQLRKEE